MGVKYLNASKDIQCELTKLTLECGLTHGISLPEMSVFVAMVAVDYSETVLKSCHETVTCEEYVSSIAKNLSEQ